MLEDDFLIFIVEDDPWYGEFLEASVHLFPNVGVQRFSTAKACINALGTRPSLITLDYRLPEMGGKDALRTILEKDPKVKVVVVSAQEDIETAVDLLKHGAYDYLVKNEQTRDRLWNIVKILLKEAKLEKENLRLKEQLQEAIQPVHIVGKDASIKRAKSIAEKAAKGQSGILICGPSGTGKKTFAKYIHQQAGTATQPFLIFSPIGLTDEQIEHLLFGHETISASGIQRELGLLIKIGKGTLVIEHFDRLPLPVLELLDQVQRNKHFYSKGSNYKFDVKGKIIFTSQVNSEQWLKTKPLMVDLLFSLAEIRIELPSLNQRSEDIALLGVHFLEQTAIKNQHLAPSITKKAIEKLQKHTYHGNLRELRAIIDLAIALSKKNEIDAEDLVIQGVNKHDQIGLNEEKSMDEYQKEIIHHYLDKYQQKVLVVAEKLKISKSSIYNLLKKERGFGS
jgi:two-component system, NtrC family, response regulator AtoC